MTSPVSFGGEILTAEEVELVRDHAVEAEQTRQWPQAWLELARGRDLFRLIVPERYGGAQITLPELLPILEQCSRAEGSFGWTLTLGIGAGLFAAYMDPGFARRAFTEPGTYIAGSGYPAGEAKTVNGDFRVSGRWSYASGSDIATLFTANAVVTSSVERQVRSFAFYPDEIEIVPSWKSTGLKATASHDFKVQEATIPDSRSFLIEPARSRIEAAIYRYPFKPFARCTLAFTLIGITRHFLDEAAHLIDQKQSGKRVNHNPTRRLLHTLRTSFEENRDRLYEAAVVSWEPYTRGSVASDEEIKRVEEQAKTCTAASLDLAGKIYPHLGMTAIIPDRPVNRTWRDLHTAAQHTLLTPNPTQ